ncbi:MAG: GNAT family N-acetyltransferase [Anaerolineae bacterium]|nr:GNAT family N-acetyltransferase [Anaerolineae bacterium]
MTFWRLLRSGALFSGMRMGIKLMKRMAPAFKPVERDRKLHMKNQPYVYLQIIGIATVYQGQGFGGRLLRALIRECDDAGLPIYLETETKQNVSMYQRFRFNVVKKIDVPVIRLPLWEMVRYPGQSS